MPAYPRGKVLSCNALRTPTVGIMKRARKGPTLKELSAALEVEAKSLQSMHREVVTELDNLKAEEQHLNNILQHYEAQIEALRAKSNLRPSTEASPAAAEDSASD